MESNPRAEEAFSTHRQIEANEKMRRQLLVDNAALLVDMLDKEYYKDILGDEDAPWAGYLGQLEVYYSRFQVDAYVRVYKKLTLKLGIPSKVWADIPITRLADCLKLVDETNYEDWFTNALILTAKDWNIKVREAKGLVTEETEGHEHDMIEYDICKQCGLKQKHRHDSDTITEGDTSR